MIHQFRIGDLEVTFDSDGEGVSPEAAETYLMRTARVAWALWKKLPNEEPATADTEGDSDA